MILPFFTRSATSNDNAAVTALFDVSSDTGRIAIAAHYHCSPLKLHASLNAKHIAVVAEDRKNSQVIGVGMGRLEEFCQFNDATQPAATLHSLAVDPTHRGGGVAKALTAWRISEIQASLGADALILASVQQRNEASLAVTRSWRQTLLGPLHSCLTPTLKKAPRINSDLSIRWAEDADWPEIAEKLNQFYRNYYFFAPETADTLKKWTLKSPLEQTTRRYLVATDKNNNLVAGLGVTAQYRFMQMKVTRLPWALRALNYFVKMTPPDGCLKQSAANYFWFTSGHAEAAHDLWQEMRWRISPDSSHMTFTYDPRGPFPSVIRLPRWMPKGSLFIAANQLPLNNERLLCSP
jgi:L-amino acid N-acyltransferase YncA